MTGPLPPIVMAVWSQYHTAVIVEFVVAFDSPPSRPSRMQQVSLNFHNMPAPIF
jgi:hypothetical protein